MFKKLHYRGQVIHFAMHACFCGNPIMDTVDLALVRKNKKLLVKHIEAHHKKTGMYPTPMLLITKIREQAVLSKKQHAALL